MGELQSADEFVSLARRYEVHSLEQQCKRAWAQLQERPSPLAKYTCASKFSLVSTSRERDELTPARAHSPLLPARPKHRPLLLSLLAASE